MTEANNNTFSAVADKLATLPPGQPGQVLDLLARMLDRTDTALHKRSGISRATVNAKRTGRSPVRLEDLQPLARAIDAPIDVLLLRPSEAARWLLDHHGEQLDQRPEPGRRRPQSRCTALATLRSTPAMGRFMVPIATAKWGPAVVAA